MLHRIAWVALVVFGCAGGSAPPKSAEAPDPGAGAAEESAAAKENDSGAESAAPSTAEHSGDASSTPASKEDAQAVLQLVLDDDALGPYLHSTSSDPIAFRCASRDATCRKESS
jgi:hypothetical protein